MDNWISKNNKAWNQLFEKLEIIKIVNEKGYFEITADQIREFGREPRLMTKFDSSESLPNKFIENDLAILPIKRGAYIIGRFQNYQSLEINNNIDVVTKYLPDYVTSIEHNNITSEAISLNAAYISGMLEDIIGEELIPTIQGRMSTGKFNYNINLKDNRELNIEVKNSQMEIDGSYESISKFVILEAKNHYIKDFIIRQLYYPYKVWKQIVNKTIIPIILIKHDNIYNFFIYEFLDDNNYNSLKLKSIKRYILEEIYQPIELSDIFKIMEEIETVEENTTTPFPQANSFYRVLDLINEINTQELSYIDVSEIYQFDIRQANYYLSAAEYLGLIEKDNNYKLSALGKNIMSMNHKNKNIEIIKLILSHKPFYIALEQYINNFDFDNDKIAEEIYNSRSEINSMVTAGRRTSTVTSWIKWVIELTSIFDSPL